MGIMHKIWDKREDGNRAEQRSLIRVSIIAFCVFLIFLCIKSGNLFQWMRAGVTISGQNREIKANQKKIKELDRTIYILNHDRDSLEKFARERFHFAQKGDDIYLVDE